MEYHEFMKLLHENKCLLTRQQYRTLKGQAKAGEVDAAAKGLNKLIERIRKEWEKQSPRCSLCRQPSSYHM